jgi:hypothetical protein
MRIGEGLRERLRARGGFNVSEFCRMALESELDRMDRMDAIEKVENMIERLGAGKEEFDECYREQGIGDGTEWARGYATYAELVVMRNARHNEPWRDVVPEDWVTGFEDGCKDADDDDYNIDVWAEGFITGALREFDSVRDSLAVNTREPHTSPQAPKATPESDLQSAAKAAIGRSIQSSIGTCGPSRPQATETPAHIPNPLERP